MKLLEIARILGATLQNASPETEITGVAGIENAGPQQITFISNSKYASLAKSTRAAAILVTPDFAAAEHPCAAPCQPLPGILRRRWSFFISLPSIRPAFIPRR